MDSQVPQDYKLIVDPHLRKGHPKVIRFGGEIYKPEAFAQGQVIVHDPRSRAKLRGRQCVDLRVPRYKVDAYSTNDLPPLELTLSNLNDNVTEPFIKDMCEKYGKRTLERVKIYYHPETSKHMGLAKLIFSSIRAATSCANDLHQTSIMGNIVSAVIDSKGEVLKHLYDKIVNGGGERIHETLLPDVIRQSQEAFHRRNEPPKHVHDEARRRSSGDHVHHHHQRPHHQHHHHPRHDQRHHTQHDQRHHHHQPPPAHGNVKQHKHNHHLVTDYDARHPPKEKPPPSNYAEHHEEPHTPEMDDIQPEENEDSFYPAKKPNSFHHHPQHQIRQPPPSTAAAAPHHLHHRHPQAILHPSVAPSVVPPPQHPTHKTTPPLTAVVAKTSTSSNVASSYEGADSDYQDDDDEVIVSSSKKSKKSKKKSKKNKHNKKKEARSKHVLPKELEDKIEGLLESHKRSNNLESINNNNEPQTPPEGGTPSHKRVENFAPRRFTPDDLEDGECSGDEDAAASPPYGGASPSDSPPIVTTPPEPDSRSPSVSAPPLYPGDIKSAAGSVSSSSSRSPAVHVPLYQPAQFQRRPLSPSSRRGEPVRPPLVPPPSAAPARFRGPAEAIRFDARRLPGSPTLPHLRPRSPPMPTRLYHPAPRASLRRSPSSGGGDFDHRRQFHRPKSPPPPGFIHHPPPPHPGYGRRRSPVRFAPPPSHANRYELRHDGIRYPAPPIGVDDPHSSDRFREFRGSRPPPPGGIVLPPPGLEGKRDNERFAPNPYPKDDDRKDHHLERPYSPGDAPVDGKRPEGVHTTTASSLPPLPIKQQVNNAETSNNNEDDEEEEEDKPQLTLDERLREMISSPEASPEAADASVVNSEAHSSSGSVDMEISSGESDQPPGGAATPLRPDDGGKQQHMGENYPSQQPPGAYPPTPPVAGVAPAVGPNIRPGPTASPAAAGPHWQNQNNIWRPHFNQRFMMGQRLPWGIRGEHPGQFNHRLAPPPPRRHNIHPPPPNSGTFPPRGPPGPFPPHPRHPSFRPTDGTRMFGPAEANQEPPANWNNPPWLPQQPGMLRHMQQQQPPFPSGAPAAGNGSFITGFNGPRIGPAPHQQLPNGKQPPETPAVETIDPKVVLIDLTSDSLVQELKGIIKRDMMKKMIETVAYKQFESWYEEASYKSTTQSTNKTKTEHDEIKQEPSTTDNKTSEIKQADNKLRGLMSTFDPLNWAKGHFEMDGFRIGLGLKTALSKMPSFRVKKVPKKEEDNNNKGDKDYRSLRRVDGNKHRQQEEDSRSDRRKNNNEKHVKRKLPLDSDGASDYSDDDDSEDDDVTRRVENNKRVPLHVDDVFSASDDSLLSSDEDIDDVSTDSDVSDDEVEEKLNEDVTNDKKRKLVDRDDSSAAEESAPLSKRPKLSEDLAAEQNDKSKDEKTGSADVTSTADVVTKKVEDTTSPFVSPESLKNIPPKKRFRYYSQDEPSNLDLIADVVCERIRPDSESSSRGPDIASPTTPIKQENVAAATTTTTMKTDDDPLFSDDDAVRMLMLISQGSSTKPPPMKEIKTEVPEPKPTIDEKFFIKRRKEPLVTKERRDAVLAIVDIHSYFAIAERPEAGVADVIRNESVVDRLFAEHSYSYHPGYNPELRLEEKENEKPDVTSLLPSPMPAPMSAAERVKLKRRIRESGSGSRRRREAEVTSPTPNYLLSPPPAKKRFPVRDVMAEKEILFSFYKFGLDLEDMTYIRTEYQKLLSTSMYEWVNNTHWTVHPITCIPPPTDLTPEKSRKRGGRKRNKKKDEAMQEPHKTGCARSEGYYKLTDTTKQLQRRLMCRQADNTVTESRGLAGTNDAQSGPNPQPSASTLQTIEKSREARHMMRRIASEFGAETSDLIKYNQLMFRKKCVKFKRSQIHGWGLFAQETIAADEMVIEYVGELVRSLVADKRELGYTKRGIGSSYLFRIDQEHIIDATKCGNYARFMNHSCNPSCYAKVITVDSHKKIVIYSKDIIKAGEEITYDYKFPIEDVKIPCYCGAPNCRGTLN